MKPALNTQGCCGRKTSVTSSVWPVGTTKPSVIVAVLSRGVADRAGPGLPVVFCHAQRVCLAVLRVNRADDHGPLGIGAGHSAQAADNLLCVAPELVDVARIGDAVALGDELTDLHGGGVEAQLRTDKMDEVGRCQRQKDQHWRDDGELDRGHTAPVRLTRRIVERLVLHDDGGLMCQADADRD